MLEAIDLTQKLSPSTYKRSVRPLQSRLHRLQRACWAQGVGAVIVFEGWDASGKGSSIRKLTERLEPRGYELHRIREPRTYERLMPWLWRHWIKIPPFGSFGIFDRSWYGRVLVQRVEDSHGGADWQRTYSEIRSFERLLADDRYVMIKFFLHIDKKEQGRRFERLEKQGLTSWQVEPEDWEHHRKYDEYLVATEAMLEHTETEWAPWTIIGATDRRFTRIRVLEAVKTQLECCLFARVLDLPR